ncbi:PAS domain S-box protein [Methanoculleus sp.]|uniref:PAS domain-containing protein n=1 Tax=Methanoculleus sp. TaxID=90427 RepID=UPI001BD631DA|nr:PAS domain S-box protein [Methanoculleus sp.]
MQPFTPALEDLLEHLEALDRRLRPLRAGEGAVPAEDLLLQKSYLAEIYGLVDAMVAGIRSIDAEYRRYRDRFARLPAGCLCTGADGVILEANRAAGTLFGLAPDLMQGVPLDAYLLPESFPAFRSAVAALGRGEEVPLQEFSLARADGTAIPAAVAVSPSYDPGTGAAEYLWTFCEISGEKRVEEALRESEERYRELTENVSDAFLALGRDGRIVSWNRAAARLSGSPAEEAVGKSIYDLFPELRAEEVAGFFREVTETGRPGVSECRFSLHGRDHIFEVRAVPTRVGISVYLQDISARREAEEALLLANRKLNLLSDVTRHDILNRLNVLSGYLDLFRERTDDAELLEYCRKEEEAVRDVRHYMAFTAEYRHVGMATPAWQPLSRIVREGMAGLDPGEVAVEVQAGNLEVYADPLIVRVFANLIDNSLRHGERVTRIRIYPEESDRGISLVYEDDGIGIPHAEKGRLFERGFGRQTGFGLFLAREILAITDLSIRETGEPGKGARFEIDVLPGFYRFSDRGRVP